MSNEITQPQWLTDLLEELGYEKIEDLNASDSYLIKKFLDIWSQQRKESSQVDCSNSINK